MKRWWILAGCVVLLGVGAYTLSPWWALAGLAQAAQEKDADALARYVDFPRLRADLAGQLKDAMGRALDERGGDSTLDEGGRTLGAMMVDRVVERFVSPAGVANLMRHSLGVKAAEPHAGASRGALARRVHERVRLEWVGVSAVRIVFVHADGRVITTGRLEREGLHWRLVGLAIPGLGGAGVPEAAPEEA